MEPQYGPMEQIMELIEYARKGNIINIKENYYIVTDLLEALLGNKPENTYHSNEYATIGSPLLGNVWVDTPDNNT
jgi:hypothetical protein